MFTKPEQLAAAGQAQLDANLRFATLAAEGVEKLMDLQFKNAKTSFNEVLAQAKAFSELKDVAQVTAWAGTRFQPGMDKAAAYAKSLYEVTSGTQHEMGALIEAQVAEFNKSAAVALDSAFKSAPAGSESAVAAAKSVIGVANSVYESLSKATRQLSTLTESNLAAAGSKKKAS